MTAWLYARSDKQYMAPPVETACRNEDTPFGQVWGLQAIGHDMDRSGAVSAEIKRMLAEAEKKLRPGTDRAYEVGKLPRQFE